MRACCQTHIHLPKYAVTCSQALHKPLLLSPQCSWQRWGLLLLVAPALLLLQSACHSCCAAAICAHHAPKLRKASHKHSSSFSPLDFETFMLYLSWNRETHFSINFCPWSLFEISTECPTCSLLHSHLFLGFPQRFYLGLLWNHCLSQAAALLKCKNLHPLLSLMLLFSTPSL